MGPHHRVGLTTAGGTVRKAARVITVEDGANQLSASASIHLKSHSIRQLCFSFALTISPLNVNLCEETKILYTYFLLCRVWSKRRVKQVLPLLTPVCTEGVLVAALHLGTG